MTEVQKTSIVAQLNKLPDSLVALCEDLIGVLAIAYQEKKTYETDFDNEVINRYLRLNSIGQLRVLEVLRLMSDEKKYTKIHD